MTVSVSTVEASRPDALRDAAGAMSGRISRLETIIAGEREDLARLQQSWQGDAAGAGLSKGPGP